MKTYYSLFISLFFIFQGQAQVLNYQIGDEVADFFVTDTEGNNWQLYELTGQGKYVYLDFFFADCAPCWDVQPIFNEFYDTYGCNQGELAMLAINEGRDTDQEVRDYEKEYGGSFRYAPAISGEGGSAAVVASFGVQSYPTVCLIGPNNRLLERQINVISVQALEAVFPQGLDPQPMECTELGVDDFQALTNITMSPNPLSRGSALTLTTIEPIISAKIFTIEGELVHTIKESSTNIVVYLNESSGLYLLKIQTESGFQTKKLIVH